MEGKIAAAFRAGRPYPADWSNLELYCVNYSIYRKAVEDLATRGFSIVNSQGSESRNPALSAKADAERIMIKMASLLGFDPVSRRRNPPETEEEDELDHRHEYAEGVKTAKLRPVND